MKPIQSFKVLLPFLLSPTLSFSHAIVFPNQSETGSWEKYVLRVPNEKTVPTVNIELTFPEALKVVSFQDVPGWKLTIHKDSSGFPIAAEWKGNLAPDRFVEFPFVAVNPDTPAILRWPTTQEYAGGELVNWVGHDTSDTPASLTRIESPSPALGDSADISENQSKVVPEEKNRVWYNNPLGWVALGVSLFALAIPLVRKHPPA